MGASRQFYIEEDFPTHPKAVKAGGDACWLWVCGTAWASKHLTGQIPYAQVPQLSDRRNPMRLAFKLCEVGLWHDRGDHFEIHDFEVRNRKALERRRKGKLAAEVRWRDAPSNAPSNAPSTGGSMLRAMLNGCSSDALEPTNQRTNEPTSIAIASTGTSSPSPVGGDSGDNEPANHTEALRKLAVRDMQDRNRDCPDAEPIVSELMWLMAAMERRRRDYRHVLARLSPACTVAAVIEEIDQAKAKPGRRPVRDWGCVCEGTSMVLADETADLWTFCPECHPRAKRPA